MTASLILTALLSLSIRRWWTEYRPCQLATASPEFAAWIGQIQAQCKPDEIVVTLGLDWNPTILFAAGRRGLMIPNWPEIGQEDVREVIRNITINGYKVGMVIFASDGPNGITREWVYGELREAGLIQ